MVPDILRCKDNLSYKQGWLDDAWPTYILGSHIMDQGFVDQKAQFMVDRFQFRPSYQYMFVNLFRGHYMPNGCRFVFFHLFSTLDILIWLNIFVVKGSTLGILQELREMRDSKR